MIFETHVTNIGPEAEMFQAEKMLIFSGMKLLRRWLIIATTLS